MAASPKYKVYDSTGVYQASVKEIEAGALLMSLYGDGSTIRIGHSFTVWTEGTDGQGAESYDHVAQVAAQREGR